jgi:peroxiredoxin
VQLQQQYETFQEAGVEVIAAVVAPVASADGARRSTGATYPLLADPAHRVAEAYGVYNLLGDALAAPAVFVIDADGRIVWHHVGQDPGDRPGVQTILEQLAQVVNS